MIIAKYYIVVIKANIELIFSFKTKTPDMLFVFNDFS